MTPERRRALISLGALTVGCVLFLATLYYIDFQLVFAAGRRGVLFEHEKIPFPSFPHEWPPEMLWAAGKLTLEIARAALAEGFDEGLLVDEQGRISEGTITNVGFWRDGTVMWPDAPKLQGITMLLLRRQLTAAGIPQAEAPVCVHDLASYQGMILSNSHGWAPVSRVDELMIPQDKAFTDIIAAAMDQCRWDAI